MIEKELQKRQLGEDLQESCGLMSSEHAIDEQVVQIKKKRYMLKWNMVVSNCNSK